MSYSAHVDELNNLHMFYDCAHTPQKSGEVLGDISSFLYQKYIPTTWNVIYSKKMDTIAVGSNVNYLIDSNSHSLLSSRMVFKVPPIKVKEEFNDKIKIAWTHNLGHNRILDAEFICDGIIYTRFDNVWLDFESQFFQDGGAGKRKSRQNGIGNIPALEEFSNKLPEFTLDVWQPWFYSMHSFSAFPIFFRNSQSRIVHKYTLQDKIGNLLRMKKYNEKKKKWIDEKTSEWNDHLKDYLELDSETLEVPELWGRYAMVTEQELNRRKSCFKIDKEGKYKDEVLFIRDVIACDDINPSKFGSYSSIDLTTSNPCLAIFWSAENNTAKSYNYHSNYTTEAGDSKIGYDPIKST
ncbi:major capsid protein, partial [mine drainage metagenome]